MNQDLANLILLFAIYAFLGWTIETFFKSIRTRKFVNSGFLFGPFCPVYGFGALMVLQSRQLVDGAASIVGPTAKTFVSILLAIMVTTALEYLTGALLEKIFKRKWWDYSEERFNLHGRVCLKYSMYWGMLAYLLLEFINPLVVRLTSAVSMDAKQGIASIIVFYMISDLTHTVKNALTANGRRYLPYHWHSWKRQLNEYFRLPSAFSRLSQAITRRIKDFRGYLNEKWGYIRNIEEYRNCIHDVVYSAPVEKMKQFRHHGSVTCFEHSLNVSFYSFILCRALGLDYKAAARAGLLHDLFLYDWRTTKPSHGKHAFIHPQLALNKASAVCLLNEVEKDIILKHMFPLTWQLPSYKESWVVCLVDKCCACVEIIGYIFTSEQLIDTYTVHHISQNQ